MWSTNPLQYEFARWFEIGNEKFKIISVEIVSEREKRFSTILQNLITSSDNTVLKTNYAYRYMPRQHILYRNEWWEIVSVGEMSLELNPQALGLVNCDCNKQTILEIKRVAL